MKSRLSTIPVLLLSAACVVAVLAPSVWAASESSSNLVPQRFFALIAAQQAAAPQAAAPAQSSAAAQTGPVYPDGPGKDLTMSTCSNCHSNDTWAAERHTYDDWGAIIQTMISNGADVSDANFTIINGYLASKFGVPPAKGTPAPAAGTTPAPAPATTPAPSATH